MERREFLKKAGFGAACMAAASMGGPYVIASPKFQWKMVTSWPPKMPILQDGAERLAKKIEEMSEGRIKIQVYAGGELVPPLEVFNAVSQGTVECGHAAAYYWAGKNPAFQWFSAVPFGLNAQGMSAWFRAGNGLKLWEEAYMAFNVIPRPGGSTGVQMGGWFNKQINTIEDFKGLKMRIPGLGGKVLSKVGCAVTLTPGAEIFTNLERGVIDATEWVGPAHDLRMGFYKVAKFYYYPGWHEPGTYAEFVFNKKAYESLPKDLQSLVDAACADTENWILAQFEYQNAIALEELVTKHGVKLIKFPDDVMTKLSKINEEVLEEEAKKDPLAIKVHEDFKNFKKIIGSYAFVSEKAFYDQILQIKAVQK